jgi:hypothetical protein
MFDARFDECITSAAYVHHNRKLPTYRADEMQVKHSFVEAQRSM